jgi:hypothetical protein
MILILIVFMDYWLLWFARKNLASPQNFEIHVLITLLLIVLNSIFLFWRSDFLGKAEKAFFAISTRWLGPVARFVNRNSAPIFVLVLAYGVVVRFDIILTSPIDPNVADMLPLIRKAMAAFLSGDYPYQFYHLPWKLPLYYFPLLWLSYIPAHVLRLDIRIIGVLISAVLLFIFWHESRRARESAAPSSLKPLLVFLPGIFFFLSPYTIFFTASGHSYPYWFCLAFFLYFLRNDKPAWAAVFLGLAVSTRQPAVILVPFYLIYLFKNFRRKECLFLTALMAISAAVLILPFFLVNPKAFLFDSLLGVEGELSYGWPTMILGSVGLTNAFFYFGITRYLKIVQVTVLALIFGLALFKLRNKVSLFIFSGFALFFYNIFLFYIPSHYFYIPVFIIFSFAALEHLGTVAPMKAPPPLAIKKFLKSLAITIVPVLVLFLFFADFRGVFIRNQTVLHQGFHQAEKNEDGSLFNWAVGQRAAASFPASLMDIVLRHDRSISFLASPFQYPNSPPQRMEIFVNDTKLSDIPMENRWKRYSLDIPTGLLYVGCNTIEFHFAYAAAPSKVLDSKDRRELAAAFRF